MTPQSRSPRTLTQEIHKRKRPVLTSGSLGGGTRNTVARGRAVSAAGPRGRSQQNPAAFGTGAATSAQRRETFSGGKPQKGSRAKEAVGTRGKGVREAQGAPEPFQGGRPHQAA